MKEPYKWEQEYIESLLNENKPIKAYEYIIKLLKGDNKDDINLHLLSISFLDYIASEYFLIKGKEMNFLKASSKAEKLIKKLKTYKAEELKLMLLNFEASLQQSKFKRRLIDGDSSSDNLKSHLQFAISNYWRSLKLCNIENEKYNIRNNLGNCLVLAGRFVEAISLFNKNIQQVPNRFQSFASWGYAMEKLKHNAILPDIPSFYFALAERYQKAKELAPNNHLKEKISNDIDRCKFKLMEMELELNEASIKENRYSEKEEFDKFNSYRKFVLEQGFALNEHSLHCFCSNSEQDNLSIGIYRGSIHMNNSESQNKLDSYLNRVKSEYVFARLLFYKYQLNENHEDKNVFYSQNDYVNTAFNKEGEILGYRIEHIRTSYRVLYGTLDKIASAILLQYNIPENGKSVYFEDVFYQFAGDLESKKNIHLDALHSISLDLNQSIDGAKVGSLGFYKKIRNRMEHGLLILTKEESDFESNKINIIDFKNFLFELLRLTKSAIFSLNYLIRTETFFIGKN